MHLRLEPDHRLVWTRDVFGNSVALVDWLQPSDTLTIVNDVQIARTLPFPFTAADRWIAPLPPQYEVMEQAITDVYRLAAFPDSEESVRRWLNESLTVIPSDAESTVENLCILIHTTIAYQRRVEKGVQTPARTLELRSGSCRDMATLMMDASASSASLPVLPADICTVPPRLPDEPPHTPGPKSICRSSDGGASIRRSDPPFR